MDWGWSDDDGVSVWQLYVSGNMSNMLAHRQHHPDEPVLSQKTLTAKQPQYVKADRAIDIRPTLYCLCGNKNIAHARMHIHCSLLEALQAVATVFPVSKYPACAVHGGCVLNCCGSLACVHRGSVASAVRLPPDLLFYMEFAFDKLMTLFSFTPRWKSVKAGTGHFWAFQPRTSPVSSGKKEIGETESLEDALL